MAVSSFLVDHSFICYNNTKHTRYQREPKHIEMAWDQTTRARTTKSITHEREKQNHVE